MGAQNPIKAGSQSASITADRMEYLPYRDTIRQTIVEDKSPKHSLKFPQQGGTVTQNNGRGNKHWHGRVRKVPKSKVIPKRPKVHIVDMNNSNTMKRTLSLLQEAERRTSALPTTVIRTKGL